MDILGCSFGGRSSVISCVVALVLLFLCHTVTAVEFTFELADDSEDCFYEKIKANTSVFVEFQVTAGGHLDVDYSMKDPHGREIYTIQRATFHSHQFVAEVPGEYTACFGNKFSSFTHKFVYVDFQVGDEPALPNLDEHAAAFTAMGFSSQSIHKSLSDILDAQTHHRLSEAQGRKRAEELNERVMWWSCLETAAILIIGISQILVLRNFFTDRKPSQSTYRRVVG